MSSKADLILGRLSEALNMSSGAAISKQFQAEDKIDYEEIERQLRNAIERSNNVIPECPCCGEIGTLDKASGVVGVVGCIECGAEFVQQEQSEDDTDE